MNRQYVAIVEDNPANLELATDLLEVAGYSVISAQSGEEAIELISRELPSVVLMDISLPGMDGLETTRVLKNDDGTRDIPIVALTAHAMAGDEEMARNAGCDGYITKPVNVKTFAGQVAEFIRAA